MTLALSMALAGSLFATQAQQTALVTIKKSANKTVPKASEPSVATQLNEMKRAMEAQQQIHQLIDQAQTREQRIQQLEQRLDQSQTVAVQA